MSTSVTPSTAIPNIPVFRHSTESQFSSSEPHTAQLPHDSANVRGGDPLGPPPHKLDTGMAPIPVSGTRLLPVSDAKLTAETTGRGPRVVTSEPAIIAAAKDFYETWTANENEVQKDHAKKRSTVFSLMQYRYHPDTDAPLWTREQWDGLVAALDAEGVLDRHAAIWHDMDEKRIAH